MTISPFWLRFGLTFIIPIAFAVTVPVEALIGRLDNTLMLTMILLVVGLGVGARRFWKVGLSHYSGAFA